MKNKFLHGAAALALCAGFVACSEYDAGLAPETLADIKSLQYETAFVQKFGKIDPAQDWGFGSGAETRAVTRAGSVTVNTWTLTDHDDSWMDYLDFDLPSDHKTLTKENNKLEKGNVYYVPSDFDGTIDFNGFDGDIYVASKITNYWGNPGNVNLYILPSGSWECGLQPGSTKIYNQGTLSLGPWDLQTATYIPEIYNAGTFTIGNKENNANIANDVKIYSTEDIKVLGKSSCDDWDEIFFMPTCDIHGIINVDAKNFKIQNSTKKYICGIVSNGIVKNIDGPLQVSYIEADKFIADGNHIYLLPEGHIKANTVGIAPNSNCDIHGYEGSVALVEATNYEFGNKNDFTHTFSDNIYFKVNDGGYIKIDGCFDGGTSHKFTSVTDYLNFDNIHYGNQKNDEYDLVKDRLNNGNATGKPECGDSWTVGDDKKPDPTPDEVKYYGRVFCEDLGAIGDFDFNDVVFDAKIYESGKIEIEVLAAGGTLPINVADRDVSANMGYMMNTGVNESGTYPFTVTADEAKDKGWITIKDIPVVVLHTETAGDYTEIRKIQLQAEVGKAPQKFCVDQTNKNPKTPWADEYISIEKAYTSFGKWVNGTITDADKVFSEPVTRYTDHYLGNNNNE